MKKLKKSSNSKSFKVVVFYGAFAVGKYTVANEFQKRSGYKFFHNHHVYDLVRSVLERGTINFSRLYENIYFDTIKEIAETQTNTVVTHAYSAKYVSHTGLSDPDYMKKIERIVQKSGGVACFVHLQATKDALLKRVAGNSRKKFLKLKDPKVLEGILNDKNKDFITSAPVKNNLVIDNTNLSPGKVVDIVIKHFDLK